MPSLATGDSLWFCAFGERRSIRTVRSAPEEASQGRRRAEARQEGKPLLILETRTSFVSRPAFCELVECVRLIAALVERREPASLIEEPGRFCCVRVTRAECVTAS